MPSLVVQARTSPQNSGKTPRPVAPTRASPTGSLFKRATRSFSAAGGTLDALRDASQETSPAGDQQLITAHFGRGHIGLAFTTELNTDRVLVTRSMAQAAAAGIQPGDEIVSVAGVRVATSCDTVPQLHVRRMLEAASRPCRVELVRRPRRPSCTLPMRASPRLTLEIEDSAHGNDNDKCAPQCETLPVSPSGLGACMPVAADVQARLRCRKGLCCSED